MSTQKIFSPEQLNDFEQYVKVQESGKYNMFQRAARKETGMTQEQYRFVMANYANLKIAFLEKEQQTK